ncbi:serine--tRNA ligase [Mesomycoplasma lagogenitalium]|uniref:Serine--tRNA ligase n=1 Tax=Mesomycoplasma lagogenitalium TaxID=171286 RepID=A0ABY8LTQ2_9BACT|nr:serine--tRNA ligase [Mesomycoplasma lagogenitalium]WGI36619.1 serine--tRNA ligase [Mesomycoplasma lagogenitalium]
MLNIKYILNNKNAVVEGLKKRNFDTSVIDKIEELGKQRSELMSALQVLENQRNEKSALIGKFVREKKDPTNLKKEVQIIKDEIEIMTLKTDSTNKEIDEILMTIPNLPLDDVPFGVDENDNVVIETNDKLGRGTVKALKPHYEIGVELDILDFTRAVKMSGSRFAIFKNEGAKLIRALVSFMLDVHSQNDYIEMVTPTMVMSKMLYGTGQLPKFSEDLYRIENNDLWMIPTAEVTLTNYHNDEILDLTNAKKYVGYTKCYRSESGSGGKDTKGLIRSHEFHKVELVKITNKEQALKEFEKTVNDASSILEKLKIPYRKLLLSSGDLGFSSRKTIDLELWLPSEQRYREVSSISYFGDFQARRAMIRYKNQSNSNEYAHTINGSGIAIDRVFAAILEQYQNEDGSIDIPEVLVPYMNNLKKITKK